MPARRRACARRLPPTSGWRSRPTEVHLDLLGVGWGELHSDRIRALILTAGGRDLEPGFERAARLAAAGQRELCLEVDVKIGRRPEHQRGADVIEYLVAGAERQTVAEHGELERHRNAVGELEQRFAGLGLADRLKARIGRAEDARTPGALVAGAAEAFGKGKRDRLRHVELGMRDQLTAAVGA